MVVAPAMNNAMYEHSGDTGQPAACCASAGCRSSSPGSGRWPRGREGVGRLAEPARLLEVCEATLASRSPPARTRAGGRRPGELAGAAGARQRRGHTGADRQRSLHRQQLLRAHGLRTGRGRAPTAGARSRRWPPTSRSRPTRVVRRDVPPRPSCRAPGGGVPGVRRAAHVGRGGRLPPAEHGARGKINKAGRDQLELELEPTPDMLGGAGGAGVARTDAGRLRRRARGARTRARAQEARGEGAGRDRRERHLAARTSASTADANEVTIVTARRSTSAGAQPEHFSTCRGPPRRRSRRRSSTPSSACVGLHEQPRCYARLRAFCVADRRSASRRR